MGDLCMCGHEEREHEHQGTWSPTCNGCDDCDAYRRDPQRSSFRGPAARFSREEAAGWIKAFGFDPLASNFDSWIWRGRFSAAFTRLMAHNARESERRGDYVDAACRYLAARILRAVRP